MAVFWSSLVWHLVWYGMFLVWYCLLWFGRAWFVLVCFVFYIFGMAWFRLVLFGCGVGPVWPGLMFGLVCGCLGVGVGWV